MQTAKSIMAGCLSALIVLCLTAFGRADQLNGANDPALLSFRRSLAGVATPGVGIATSGEVTERGALASDTIRGNGTRAGYVLSHGGVVPNSETVTVDGSMRHRGRDYYLDSASGALAFAAPIRPHQSVRVTYRYVAGSDAKRTAMAGPALSLNIGPNNKMGILYAYQADAGWSAKTAFDMLTYGLSLNTNLGNQSSMSNMLYFSSPKDSGRVSVERLRQGDQTPPTGKPKSDSLFLHNSDLKLGKLSIKPMFQEVGADFAGFTALRQQGGMAEDLVSRLEKEKGLKRLGFQADYTMGAGSASGLGFSQIEDNGAKITRQSISIGGPTVKVAGSIQEIGEQFTRFKDLSEPERDQWAKEKGVKRTSMSLSLAPSSGLPKDSAWNSLMTSRISDKTGDITLDSLNFAAKRFGMSATRSKVDAGFARLANLSEDDRANLALRIRQEFDPNATVGNLTPEDRQHAAREVGIERQNIRATAQLGGLSTALQMLELGDGTNGLTRQSLALAGKSYSIAGFLQEIDKDFDKLGILSPVEKLSFANERGMRRTNLAGDLMLNPQLRLKSSFSQVKADEGDVTRYGLDLTGKGFWLRGDFRDIDPGFNRAMDLADADKQQLAAEQGFSRHGWAGHYESAKRFTFDSSFLDMKHANDGRFQRRLTNNLVLTPSGDLKLTVFRDEDARNTGSAESKLLRQMFRLDNKIGIVSLNAVFDTATTTPTVGEDSKVETKILHFNTLPGRAMTLIGDWKNVQRTDGTFEDTQVLKLDTVLAKTLNFKGTRSVVKTDTTEAVGQEYSLVGKVPGGLNLAAKFGETLFNGLTSGKVRELSLSPQGPKDFGAFKSTSWALGFGEVRKGDKPETQTKSARLDTTIVKHRLTAEYLGQITKEGQTPIIRSFSLTSDPDPAKRLHYSLAYKVRDPGAAPSLLIRRYNADMRLSGTTKLEYSYFTYKEQPNGVLEPVGGEHARLTTALTKRLAVLGEYDLAENYAQSNSKRTLSIGLSGKVSSLEVLEASYGYDRVESPSGKSSARTYKLKYDYQVNPEHFLTLTGQYTDWSGPQPANIPSDDLHVMLDFRTVWN